MYSRTAILISIPIIREYDFRVLISFQDFYLLLFRVVKHECAVSDINLSFPSRITFLLIFFKKKTKHSNVFRFCQNYIKNGRRIENWWNLFFLFSLYLCQHLASSPYVIVYLFMQRVSYRSKNNKSVRYFYIFRHIISTYYRIIYRLLFVLRLLIYLLLRLIFFFFILL